MQNRESRTRDEERREKWNKKKGKKRRKHPLEINFSISGHQLQGVEGTHGAVQGDGMTAAAGQAVGAHLDPGAGWDGTGVKGC